MARGWESKDVESQQEAREDKPARKDGVKSPEELADERRLAELKLSRIRVLRDLFAARSERHRDMIKESLVFLDREIEKITGSASEPQAE